MNDLFFVKSNRILHHTQFLVKALILPHSCAKDIYHFINKLL
jgi:hypothetical protein